MRQRTKKYNKNFETELNDFKKNPDKYLEELSSVQSSIEKFQPEVEKLTDVRMGFNQEDTWKQFLK